MNRIGFPLEIRALADAVLWFVLALDGGLSTFLFWGIARRISYSRLATFAKILAHSLLIAVAVGLFSIQLFILILLAPFTPEKAPSDAELTANLENSR